MENQNKVSVGDEVNLTIETVGKKGDGLAKIDNFVVFVPGVKEGDNVKVKITKVLTNVGFGEVVGQGVAPATVPKAEPIEDSEDFGDEAPVEETKTEEPVTDEVSTKEPSEAQGNEVSSEKEVVEESVVEQAEEVSEEPVKEDSLEEPVTDDEKTQEESSEEKDQEASSEKKE